MTLNTVETISETLHVTGQRPDFSYPIIIGAGMMMAIPAHLMNIWGDATNRKYILISDRGVMDIYGADLYDSFAQHDLSIIAQRVLPVGEDAKSFSQLEETLNMMLDAGIDRQTVVIALGGGVVGDHAGFAAAIALRGVPFIQIPTTLLAMVDSAVGGKTGINAAQGKNLIGSFHQPTAVFADVEVLNSLPARDFNSGYAEVVKYAFIHDRPFFDDLNTNHNAIVKRDRDALCRIVSRCCAHKAAIVQADEKEQGQRALLNLGHTFGHALEAENAYGSDLLHGEAVAIGMVMAFSFSAMLGLCSRDDVDQVISHLQQHNLPIAVNAVASLKNMNASTMIAHMQKDKKVQNGKMRFILVKGIGQAFIKDDVNESDLTDFLDGFLKHGHR